MSKKKNVIEAIYPLSPMQQGLLFHTLHDPGSGVYVEQLSCILQGDLNVPAFQRAWEAIVDRHSILRTAFIWDRRDEPFQMVYQHVRLPWEQQDWRDLSPAECEGRIETFLMQERICGFKLSTAPLLRLALFQLSATTYQFVWSHHHLLLDGWSLPIILAEVFACYAAFADGREVQLAPSRPYRDYIVWLQRQDLARAEAFWHQTLAGVTAPTPFGIDQPGPAQAVARYAKQQLQLSAPATAALHTLGQLHGLTLNTLVQGAWALLLSRYSGRDDVVFGVTVAGRPADLPGVETMVGLFINTLPVRVRVAPDAPLLDWLAELQAQQVEMRQYEYTPLVQIQGWSAVPRGVPLFESIVVFENYPVDLDAAEQDDRPRLAIQDVRAIEETNYPITIAVGPGSILEIHINYDCYRFDGTMIARMLGHIQMLLKGIVADPTRQLAAVSLLTVAEQRQLLIEWNATTVAYPHDQCIHELFEIQAARTPDAVAVVLHRPSTTDERRTINDEGSIRHPQCLTYHELNARANQLAHYLRQSGVGPEVRVGLCVERSLDMVTAMLGILKAGGAYVPLDPAYPLERLSLMVNEIGAPLLLTQAQLVDKLPISWGLVVCLDTEWDIIGQQSATNPSSGVRADNLAYVIYTSGSTGTPKGVQVPHRGLCNLAAAQIQAYDVQPDSHILQFVSFGFDVATSDMFTALLAGATLCLVPPDSTLPGPALIRLMDDYAITFLELPASVMAALPYEDLPALRTLIAGGEPCSSDLVARWSTRRRFFNVYGPTEATVTTTLGQCLDREQNPPIGRPITNMQVYLLDRQAQPVPIGVPGELYISGVGLARGYQNRPDLTAERFIPNPFADERQGDKETRRQGDKETPQSAICNLQSAIGTRLYKTGDVARYWPDGNLEFLGRRDEQVKVRGFRIELGEIEVALGQHRGVREAVVLAREDVPGGKRLTAYIVPSTELQSTPDSSLVSELQDFLKEKLPDYMVPAAFALVEALPLTPNGKVDRRALAALEQGRSGPDDTFVAPRTPAEALLVQIWTEVLRVEQVGVRDNFFVLGGHSLLATGVISRIRDTFQVELPIHSLFEAPTIAGLAEQIATARRGAPGLLPPPLQSVQRDLGLSRDEGGALPLSYAQQRLWFLDQLQPDSHVYNIPAAMYLTGPLDIAALAQTISAVVRRHEALRTTFAAVDGQPVQLIAPPRALPLALLDLQALPADVREHSARQLAAIETQRSFDLARGPLLRTTLLRLYPQAHVVLLTMHHIISDAWSMEVLIREVTTLYAAWAAGHLAALPELPIQYADYAVWQRAWLQGEVLEAQLAYWQHHLADLPVLQLPTDHPRPAVVTFGGARHGFSLPLALHAKLLALSRPEGVTLFMTLLATFQTLLAHYSAQDDIAVGTPITNRHQAETEGLIGFFLNTLVLRTDLAGNPTFQEALRRVRTICLDAYAHQDLPFEQVVEVLQPARDLSRHPLFQVMFTLEHAPAALPTLPDLAMRSLMVASTTTRFDLTLSLMEQSDGLEGTLEYRTDLFEATTITRMVNHFQTLLEGIVIQPAQRLADLPLLTATERQQLLLDWNATATATLPDQCIHQLFEAQVERTPDAVAVVFEDMHLTYHTLNARANQLAHYLQGTGVRPEDRVGVCLKRSPELVVALLGTLKAGAAYVPLDPAYPRDRLAFMLQDARAPVLLTQSDEQLHELKTPLVVRLDADRKTIAQARADNPVSQVPPDQLAYVIYTSGSTGKPKGVMVTHRNVINFFTAMNDRIGHEPSGVWLAVTSISFDISVLELLWTLTHGSQVVVQGEQEPARSSVAPGGSAVDKQIAFSLFYFASDDQEVAKDTYHLLLEGAKFADRHGFAAVWTPERHFHAFGGVYPNPSVISAGLATITNRIQIRAGSVVLPLHNPIRVAEEWSVVDNLSKGRIGLSFASGWHADDFVFAPEHYRDRRTVMLREIETVRKLWRGETVAFRGGTGNEVAVRILPQPIQPELPIWLTAAGSSETFRLAGEIGANLLTHLLGQSVEDLAEKIALYRAAWQQHGHGPGAGQVTLMLHTFVGPDIDAVREKVRTPFRNYLKSSLDLIKNMARSLGLDITATTFTDDDMEALLAHAFDRYFATSSLMGTPEICLEMIDRLKVIGVDEVGCLIDFGVDFDSVMTSLHYLNSVRERSNTKQAADGAAYALPAQMTKHHVSHMQCTPSMARMLTMDPPARNALRSLNTLLLGGETLPTSLVEQLNEELPAEIHNLYGPTETTVWSATHLVGKGERTTLIGRPIANTQIYILDRHLRPVPIGIPGELYIGGTGTARGYLHRPELTAERFVPNPFAEVSGIGYRVLGAEPSDTRYPTRFPPLSPPPAGGRGGVLYKTGDLARYRPTGDIEHLGRLDTQVKLRGFRIELGEIEIALAQHAAVREALVAVREDTPGDQRLVAYVVPAETLNAEGRTMNGPEWSSSAFSVQRSALAADLRSFLAMRLPDYMLPSAFVVLPRLPLTPNGKLDRRALPAPETGRSISERAFVAPRTPVETILAGIWAEVLRLERVGIHDNFFALGGHSLLATQLISRVRNAFRLELPLRSLFEAPSVEGLAERIARARRAVPELLIPALRPVPHEGTLPLSFAQQRLWFLDQLQPNNPVYNMPVAVRLVGALDVVAFAQSVSDIRQRHEALRTIFAAVDGQPVQVIVPARTDALIAPLPLLDLQALPEDVRETTVRRLAGADVQRSFDLARGPLVRSTLLRLGAQEYVVLLNMHHIISDGWSMGVFVRELVTLYTSYTTGEPASLPELPIQYADYALWQRQWLQGDVLEAQLAYWRTQLADLPALQLPIDRPRPQVPSFRGASQTFVLSPALHAALMPLSQAEGVTLFMTLLAAFQVIMAWYSGQDDVVVGTPIAGRTRAETEGLVGFFVNTLVLRTNLSGNPTFRALLREVREVCLEAYSHQDIPFEQIVDALQPTRDLSRNPMFQVMFALQNEPVTAVDLPSLALRPLEVEHGITHFDLSLFVEEARNGLVGALKYRTDLFDAATVRRMSRHFQTLLEGIVAQPERRLAELPLLTDAERQQLLMDWNATQADFPQDQCVHHLFEVLVAQTPDNVAIVFEEQHLTCADLNARANQVAHYLRELGVGPEVRVGLCLERSLELVVGMLGILKAGGTYVPLDPTSPAERLAFMLEDSQMPLLLTQQRLYDHLSTIQNLNAQRAPEIQNSRVVCLDADWATIMQHCVENPCGAERPDHLAYLIYTSGSTGRPKAVMVEHRNVVNTLCATRARMDLRPGDCMLSMASFAFDIAVFECLGPLLLGGTSILLTRQQVLDPSAMAMLVQQSTFLHMMPGLMRQLVQTLQERGDPAAYPRLRGIMVGGDAIATELVEQMRAVFPTAQIYLGYGPTEGTIVCTICRLGDAQVVDGSQIGRPLANMQVRLYDTHGRLVPVGVPGEIYIRGAGVARGYHNRPDLTAERFVPDPWGSGIRDQGSGVADRAPDTRYPTPGTRLYKTGDLARYRPDGELEFLGRLDKQVKVRGFRIELGEIQSVLEQHPMVREAVILAREDLPGDKRLVAYVVQASAVGDQESGAATTRRVVATPDPQPLIPELRVFLQAQLPDYMVPADIVFLKALPLTSNGKVDQRALLASTITRLALDEAFVAPRTPVEEVLVSLCARVLRLEQVRVHDNFFALGGHSLLATQLISRVRDAFQIELPLRCLFEASTMAELAEQIVIAQRDTRGLLLPPLRAVPHDGALPLSFAQQRLWFLDQLEPNSPAYNIPAAVRLVGPLDVAAMKRSLNEIVRRHEVLRTTFTSMDGQGRQVIAPAQTAPLLLLDLQALLVDAWEDTARRLANRQAQQPFDLADGPLLRVALLRLSHDTHVVLLTMHHIVSDAWSMDVLVRELSTLYSAFAAGRPSPLPELRVQYADFAIWQRNMLHGQVLEAHLTYWRTQLADLPVLQLPTDHPRLPVATFQGASYDFTLPASLSAGVRALSREEGVTLFMVLLATFQTLLQWYTGQDDIVVGTDIANRTRPEMEELIGFFVNQLVLRTNLSGNPTFREVLRRVREVCLEASTHQDLPFDKLVEVLNPARDLGQTPLFQVKFVLQNAPMSSLEPSGLTVSTFGIEHRTAKFDLLLNMVDTAHGLSGSMDYRTDLFKHASIARMLEYFEMLLHDIVAQPDSRLNVLVDMLTEADRKRRKLRTRAVTEINLQHLKQIKRKSLRGPELKEEDER